ncbi:MAG: DUF882 domain-containing protein [Candidatus Binataceae bacterium]|jgi:uncharacterized protein YcbK (DUF882 family)
MGNTRKANANQAGAAGGLDGVVSRRRILTTGALGAASLLLAGKALAADWIRIDSGPSLLQPVQPRAPFWREARYTPPLAQYGSRALSAYNLHTGEKLSTVYYEDGQYVQGALREVNYFFRDFRANEIKPIDPRLLDLLHSIHQSLETSEPFNLISGYRSAATNAMLASRSEGVARHSMHIEGRAADINVPNRQLSILQRVALALRFGGVGYYPQSDFVHVDTGRVRQW